LNDQNTTGEVRGEVRIVNPGEGQEFWQPVPANGHIAIHLTPRLVAMDVPLALGTQTVAADCYVREHAHDRHEEVIHCLEGKGCAVIDGIKHTMVPGMTIFIGKNRRHMFINQGSQDLRFMWLMTPNGLEDFFEAIGRPKHPHQPAPEPFPRPADVLELERRTVFAPQSGDSGRNR
jgi:quercetin dioxygenase-like cupin family protein